MRVVVDRFFGRPLGARIELSRAEQATLLRTSTIAAGMRELARSVDPDFEDTDADVELARVEHGARELANEPTYV